MPPPEELDRVRPTFVEKVSTQMINQLLDDILLDGIVNEMEKESITEENNIRSDKARRLIDSVRKKGESASRKLIAHIQSRDPELSAVLGLSCGQLAPPGELRVQLGSSVHSNRIQQTHFGFLSCRAPDERTPINRCFLAGETEQQKC